MFLILKVLNEIRWILVQQLASFALTEKYVQECSAVRKTLLRMFVFKNSRKWVCAKVDKSWLSLNKVGVENLILEKVSLKIFQDTVKLNYRELD